MKNPEITIIGAGLAGCEAAWQAVQLGIHVRLFEMRPLRMTEAHTTGRFAELVCSNSLRGAALTNGVGILKEELRILSSLILAAADETRVPAGGALAVDRERFSSWIDGKIREHPMIRCETAEIEAIPAFSPDNPVIVASGPLTTPPLAQSIENLLGSEHLAFFDAISPIVLSSSIDRGKVFAASRYGKGDGDEYLNVPFSREQYESFLEAIRAAEKVVPHGRADEDLRPFEGCMPIEDMALRGPDVLRYGPLKPVGLRDPSTGSRPYAVLQMRSENRERSMWNMVGMQTRMKHGEQVRIFRTLPGLENAEFVRLGSVHRNTFIQSPRCLDSSLQCRDHPGLFFAGQITGVEGYVESTAAGLVAGLNAARLAKGLECLSPPRETATGSLLRHVTNADSKDFQPMNVSFGLIDAYIPEARPRGVSKDAFRQQAAAKCLENMKIFAGEAGR